MQKFILSILCIFLITTSAFAKAGSTKFKQGVLQYKNGNYIGASETMQAVIAADPGDAVAHYYLAISYVQIGKKDEAIKEYNNVIALNPASKLISYSKQGLSYLGVVQEGEKVENSLPQITDVPELNKTKDYISDKVKETLREKELNNVINDANKNNGQVDPNTLKRLDNYTNKKSDNSAPTKEQVAQALQVLSSAGMNQNSYNPEAMQMNMLMNSLGGMSGMNSGYNNNNSMNNMMPLLMMAQNSGNKQNMDPQMMEVMMNQMMMPSMMQFNSNNNDNNY
jgi:tetratricopeptide (TPR) repeat protein